MIFVTDPQGALRYICSEWTSFSGQSREEAYTKGWHAPILSADRAIVRGVFSEASATQDEFSVRFRVHHADGTIRWLSAGGVPSFGPPDHSFLGYLGSMTELGSHETSEITAFGNVGRFLPPPTHPATRSVCRLDSIADHLIIAHALIEQDESLPALVEVSAALFKVGQALARKWEPRTLHN